MKLRNIALVMIFGALLLLGVTLVGYADEGNPPDPALPPSLQPDGNVNPLFFPRSALLDAASEETVEKYQPRIYQPKVIGGTQVSPPNLYPWIASFQLSGKHFCGGVLVAPQWVLTAAHCWTDPAYGTQYPILPEDKVILGEYDLFTVSGNEQSIAPIEIFRHPLFDSAPDAIPWNPYDVALAKLSHPVTINAYVDTIPMVSAQDSLVDIPAFIAGWGSTTYPDQTYPSVLQHGAVTVLADSACSASSAYGPSYDPISQLCAGLPDFSVDACFGDSGGPLMVTLSGTKYLAGLISWGKGCGLDGYPGVYTKISTINAWAQSTIGSNTSCFPLTLGYTGNGNEITADPTNSPDCELGTYSHGERIIVSGATPDIGWHIGGWTGTDNDTSLENNNLFSMPYAPHSVQVNYIENPTVSTWYLAEGFTGAGFGTYILIQNPNDVPTQVDLIYMLEGGTIINKEVIVDANSRSTIVTNDSSQVGLDEAFSTALGADQSIIVERAMYWPNGDGTIGGHATNGVREAQNTWYLAEGFTGGGFQTFILIQNPNGSESNVTLTYMLEDGGTITKNITIPANSRYTVLANGDEHVGLDHAFSTKLESNNPIIVERAMYFDNEGHVSNGTTTPTTTWYLAEGFTGSGYQTFILIQNPNSQSTNVQVDYMLADGSMVINTVVVPGNSRYTISVHSVDQLGTDKVFSTKLNSEMPIIVERAIYWPNGIDSIAGHNTTGIRAPKDTWYLAEGYTGAGFESFILLQNPGATSATVSITYMLQGGGTILKTISVPANSRYTILANDPGQVGLDMAFSTKLVSDQPIIVERAMYFSNGGHVVEAMSFVQ